jgi:dipeptide/tripeptide permease
MLQVVNPLLVLLTIPLMDRVVYPWLKTHGTFRYPLKRMLLGGGVAGVAFVFAGCVETRLEVSATRIVFETHFCPSRENRRKNPILICAPTARVCYRMVPKK